MPSRGRKRFVSEGDGGLVKETSWSAQFSVVVDCHWSLGLAFLMFYIFQVMGELGKKRCWLFVNNFHSEGKAYVYQWSKAQWRSCFQKWYRFYIMFAPENGMSPTSRVTSIIALPLNLWTFPIILWKISQKLFFLISCPSIIAKLKQIVIRPNLILNSIAYTQNCVYTGDCSQNLESIPKLNWIHNYPWMELWEKVVSWNHQNKCCILRSSEK